MDKKYLLVTNLKLFFFKLKLSLLTSLLKLAKKVTIFRHLKLFY